MERCDVHWGHGVKLTLCASSGAKLHSVKFFCHPESAGFESCQAMSTEELAEVARKRLESGEHDNAISTSRSSGIELLLVLNRG